MSTLVPIRVSAPCSSGNRCYGESLILFSNEYSSYLLFIRFSPELTFPFFINFLLSAFICILFRWLVSHQLLHRFV